MHPKLWIYSDTTIRLMLQDAWAVAHDPTLDCAQTRDEAAQALEALERECLKRSAVWSVTANGTFNWAARH